MLDGYSCYFFGLNIQEITFNSQNNFKFEVAKGFKIKNFYINSEINLDNLRLINVVEQIRLAIETDFDTPINREKIAHNRNRFWDYSLVEKLFKTEIVDPLMELVNG